MAKLQQYIFVIVCIVIAGSFFGKSLAGQPKVCPHPQRTYHERGICNDRLMKVVTQTVCPLYREGLQKHALHPHSPSSAAVEAANKFVVNKLQKSNAKNHPLRTRRGTSGADLEDADPLNIPVIDLVGTRSPSRRLLEILSFVRTGANPTAMWSNMVNPNNWQPINLVCECCYNVCTVQEMTQYCPLTA